MWFSCDSVRLGEDPTTIYGTHSTARTHRGDEPLTSEDSDDQTWSTLAQRRPLSLVEDRKVRFP